MVLWSAASISIAQGPPDCAMRGHPGGIWHKDAMHNARQRVAQRPSLVQGPAALCRPPACRRKAYRCT